LERFGRSTVQRWKDSSALWTQVQANDDSADDFVSRLTCLAKHLPSLDPSTIQCAITRGLKPQIRQYVLQADAKNMTELLQAARIAEMPTPSTDSSATAVLDELRASNAQHAAAFQQLSTRLDKLSITIDIIEVSDSQWSSPVVLVKISSRLPRTSAIFERLSYV